MEQASRKPVESNLRCWRFAGLAAMSALLIGCGGGDGSAGGGSGDSPTQTQRSAAAAATAQSDSNLCAPIRPFFWEIGDRSGASVRTDAVNASNVDAAGLEALLRQTVTGEVRFDDGSRALYATDGSNYRQVPIGVVVPKSVEDVVATVAACRSTGRRKSTATWPSFTRSARSVRPVRLTEPSIPCDSHT